MVIRLDSNRTKEATSGAGVNVETNPPAASETENILSSAQSMTKADVYDMDDLDRQLAQGELSPTSSPSATR